MKTLRLFLLLFILLAGCQAAAPTVIPGDSTLIATATSTGELSAGPTASMTPTLTPGPTATSDARLPPEQWREWPVVPVVTGRAIEIYRLGQALGNNTHAFSKVGDCQSVKAAFMGFYDIPERVPPFNPEYLYLEETLDNFAGYFNTDGQAVKGGYTAATVLSPFRSNPDFCLAGENPLECEFRITKPIIAFVSFEYWWEGRTAENYENYMRQIIELTMEHGVVPILSTKADNIEGDHSINLTNARLAHEYDLPLWNFWRSVQNLDYYGLDRNRDDGFHLSDEGWNYRSFTGLQALDSIWRGVRDATALALATPELTPEAVVSTGFQPTPAGGPWLSSAAHQVVFGAARREGEAYLPMGVFLYDFEDGTRVQILGYGWDFQAASPDGTTILVNLGSSLYMTDGKTLTLLSSEYYSLGNTGAMYLADGSILYIQKNGAGTALVKQNSSGDEEVITQPTDAPIDLYPSTDGINIAWESGICSSYLVCDRQGAWLTNLESGVSRFLSGITNPLIDQAGTAMAYEYSTGIGTSNLAFATADGIPTRNYPLWGDILEDYAWQPGGDWLAVHLAIRVEHSGKITDGTNYLIDPGTFTTQQLPSLLLLNPSLLWSRDGTRLAWLGTGWLTDKYVIHLFEVDFETNTTTNLTGAMDLADPSYIYVTNSAWLAVP